MEILPQYEDNLVSAGLTDSVSMSFSSDVSHLFSLMSKNLYKDPNLAAVREIITNAWDAHIDAGCADKPICIKSDGNTFTIQDFGKGLSKSEFLRLYGVVGESSKRKDNRLTGGMGIGKMAPLAALPYFSVRSHHGGIATTYHISGPTEESGGVPTITEMVSVPTDITGLEVIFPAPLYQFLGNINSVVNLGAIKAILIKEDGEEEYIKTIPDADVVVIKDSFYYGSRVRLRYGNIVYPIHHSTFQELGPKLASMLYDLDLKLIVLVEPGKAVVTPNREELVFSDKFKDYLKDRFEEVYQRLIKNTRKLILENPTVRIRYIAPAGSKALLGIDSPNEDLGTYDNSFALEDLSKYMPRMIAWNDNPQMTNTDSFKDAVICRFNRDILKTFRGMHKSSVREKLDNKFKRLIYKTGIKPKNVYTRWDKYRPGYFGNAFYLSHPLNTLAQNRKIVIHYHNPVTTYARKEDTLYIRVLMKTNVDALKKRLQSFLGSEVDIEIWENVKEEKPKQEKEVKKAEPKKYISLNSFLERKTRVAYARGGKIDKEVENPEVILSEKDWESRFICRFADWLTAEEITKDKVAVVSPREYAAMMRRKNPPKDFLEYCKEKVKAFVQEPEVLAIFQLIPHRVSYPNPFLYPDFRKLVADVLGVKTDFDDSLVNRVITILDYSSYINRVVDTSDLQNKDEDYIKKVTKLKLIAEDFDVRKLKEFGMYELFVEKLKERVND
ncbi:hypothetical protein ZC03_088 [Pseudomonas phage ZC03]|uniref:Uncharacterized protein n=2 Tax=Zicotriavirus TaxID=2843161 RepID=A0A1L2C9E2_9CAUD|nr:RIIA lysis inhibitor [Pseudomonas phage ZC03]YP_009830647.1 RIIA lysis inhibitor [Pseudomonas phage ZC08]AMD43465.1 hypothetical protein ZC03_088 [Pseudomonas phage ZC03]AMD43480.1 hypothetical protein ZC08_085 [Pseudomonas phage ZC08]